MSIGIDDTDSATEGMCTTFVATEVAERLRSSFDAGFWDYPSLIRLNPQVPNKTRGNGALALHIFADRDSGEEILETVGEVVSDHAILDDDSTHPGIALGIDGPSGALRSFYQRCLHRIVGREEALRIADSEGIRTLGMKDGIGVIGAVAALGAELAGDHTFEIIAYRSPDDHKRARDVEEELVLEMDREIGDTFYNYDYQNGKVCVVPASPCPVFFGIRGETAEAVIQGYHILRGRDSPKATVFRTNQHTDAHLEEARRIRDLIPRSSVKLVGRVLEKPRPIPGGHLIFVIGDCSGGKIDCAAYEPTKQFRNVIGELMPGDQIKVYGSVRPPSSRHGLTVNLEKVEVLSLVNSASVNPSCPRCGARMKSMGRNAGYRCKREKCGYRDPDATKVDVPVKRTLERGYYEPPPIAWRHLYKPILRGLG